MWSHEVQQALIKKAKRTVSTFNTMEDCADTGNIAHGTDNDRSMGITALTLGAQHVAHTGVAICSTCSVVAHCQPPPLASGASAFSPEYVDSRSSGPVPHPPCTAAVCDTRQLPFHVMSHLPLHVTQQGLTLPEPRAGLISSFSAPMYTSSVLLAHPSVEAQPGIQ